MALKPTIYKFKIALTDLNREVYDNLTLTVAQHPSETTERMMVRVMAFCLNAHEQLELCKGLSDAEEPDLWLRNLNGSLELWIDVGEPAADRIKKASRIAAAVKIYCFNKKSATWWELGRSKFEQLKVAVYQLQWTQVQALAELVQRTMDITMTITGDSIYLSTQTGDCELTIATLQESP